MPVVPTYQDRGIALQPGLNFRDTTHATGEMFGSQVGEALVRAGQGVGDMGRAVAEVKDLDATNEAKDSHNGLIERVRGLGYGEGGYLATSGRDAVTGYAGYEASIRQAVKDGAKGLSPLALSKYMDAATATAQGALASGEAHAMAGRKTWTVSTSEARMGAFRGEAVAKRDDPGAVTQNVVAAVMELREQGGLMGWNPKMLRDKETELVSGMYEDITRSIADSDPVRAVAYLKGNEPFLTEDARKRLNASVGEAALDEETRRAALVFVAGSRQSGETAPTAGTPGNPEAPAAGPTRQKSLLLDHTADANAPAVLNLDHPFATNLAAMIEDAPAKIRDGLSIGFRKGAGDEEGPGRTADLIYNGGSLDAAPAAVQDWARRSAGQYGLNLPIGGGPGGSVVASTDTVAARALRPSSEAIDKHLAAIADPRRREIAKQAIVTTLDQQSRQEQQQQQAAKAELWQQVEAGTAPDEVAFNVRQAAGSTATAMARSYYAKAQAGPITTDDVLLADMRLYAAERPEDFARLDLDDYRDRLEGSDLKALTQTQSAIGQDGRKARDQGAKLKTAFDMARARLEEAGALTPGEESADQRQLLARVQNTVYAGLADIRAANPKAKPTPSDIRRMIDPFLLPYYLPQPDLRRAKPVAKLSDISPDLRVSISRQLAMEFGRKPTDGEVAREYAAFMQAQGGEEREILTA